MDSFTAVFTSAVAGNTDAPRDQEAMKLRQPAPIMACVIACESVLLSSGSQKLIPRLDRRNRWKDNWKSYIYLVMRTH